MKANEIPDRTSGKCISGFCEKTVKTLDGNTKKCIM